MTILPMDKIALWGVTLNGVYQRALGGLGPDYAFPFLTVGDHRLQIVYEVSVGPVPPFPPQAVSLLENAIAVGPGIKAGLLQRYTHLVEVPGAPVLPLSPEELDAENAQAKGWRNYGVLSGWHQSYGCQWMDGWLLPVALGQVWHIGQDFHAGTIADRNLPYTVTLNVRPFGVFERGGEVSAPVVLTATCEDLDQRHPLSGFDTSDDRLFVTLHSIKPDGREALLALYRFASAQDFDTPTGFLRLAITGAEPSEMVATLEVYKSREQTMGVFEEEPLSPALSGTALVTYASTTFTETPYPPNPSPPPVETRIYVDCTFSGPGVPAYGASTGVELQTYSQTVTGRVINLAYRQDGSISEITCDTGWAGEKSQSWSGVTASGKIRGTYAPPDGGGEIRFTSVIDPVSISGLLSGEARTEGFLALNVDGVLVDRFDYLSTISLESNVSVTGIPFIAGGDVRPDTRHFNLGIGGGGIGGATNSVSSNAIYEASVDVNNVQVDFFTRTITTSSSSSAITGATITRTQTAEFQPREVYLKNSGSDLSVNNRAWAVDVRPQTNHSAYCRWGNCNIAGSNQINAACISAVAAADRHANPDPELVITGKALYFPAHYEPKTEDLVPSDIYPFGESSDALLLHYI